MQRAFDRSMLVALTLVLTVAVATGLVGCSGAAMVEQLPASIGGEPAGIPERPTEVYAYPAVHDMPPPRTTTTLTEEQQVKMEKELSTVRDKQEARDGAAKKTVQPAKKKPETANTGHATGTADTQDGAKRNP